MPSQLLEQSRAILRSRFSAVVPKRVLTLQFDRSIEDGPEPVLTLAAKLRSARDRGDVVCAAPEALKSLLLKFVELLHSLEETDVDALRPVSAASAASGGSSSNSARRNREIMALRDSMILRSEMADALVGVLRLWNEGIRIMDEVTLFGYVMP